MEPTPLLNDEARLASELESNNHEHAPRLGRLRYLATFFLAVVGVLAWAIVAGIPALQVWGTAASAPSAAVVSYEAQRASLAGYGLHKLLLVAQQECPADRPILAVSVDVRPTGQGNYEMYPRTVDVIPDTDALTTDEVAAHSGGCILYYGPADTVGKKLDPFRSRLTQLACNTDGCLYRVDE